MAVQTIRSGSFPDKREELTEMGFEFNFLQTKFDVVKVALLRYQHV
jgi:hypothetical protein